MKLMKRLSMKKISKDSKIQDRYLYIILWGNAIMKNDTSNEMVISGILKGKESVK